MTSRRTPVGTDGGVFRVNGKELLRPFQRRFVRAALAPDVDTAALSLPRGNGKSWLAAYLLAKCLTPGDPLFQEKAEYLLCAASINQARLVYQFVRQDLEPRGHYRWIDSTTRLGAVHLPTNTRLRILSSEGKTAMGIVNCPLLVADEPGSWEVNGGQLMSDAIETAQGKPGSPLKVVYIGTLAPATAGWWHELIDDGSHASTYVQALQGDRSKWESAKEIRRVNPLTAVDPRFIRKLLEERDAGRRDSRRKARFLSYRLNVPTQDESTLLLTVDEWQHLIGREVPERQGRPIVAVDLGGGRAWSAACAVWQGGRVEATAVAPGIPDLVDQEKRDRVSAGTYRDLAEGGMLDVAEGLRVQPPAALWESIRERWGIPVAIVCDRFRLAEMQDAVKGACPIEPRITRWSDSSFDIRALRAGVLDGPLAVSHESRRLLAASIAVATVKTDDAGNVRMVKSSNNTARDDVAAALALVGGAWARAERSPGSGVTHVVV